MYWFYILLTLAVYLQQQMRNKKYTQYVDVYKCKFLKQSYFLFYIL